jgi:hypothetical protein
MFTDEDGNLKVLPRTIIFILLSVILLIFYGIQKKNNTQIWLWVIITLLVGALSLYGPQNGFLNTLMLILISISGGMVLSDAAINLSIL